MAPVLGRNEMISHGKHQISSWPLRRLDRELNSVIATLAGNVKQKWWAKDGVGSSEQVVLGDSIASHLPCLGRTAVNAVLLRALLRPSKGLSPLDAGTYTHLLDRFSLGREFATSWNALETSRLESPSLLAARVGSVTNAFIAALARGREPSESDSSELMLAFLSLFCGSTASSAAASLRSSGQQLPSGTVTALTRAAVSLALDVVRSPCPERFSELLGGLSLCVAGLSGASLAGDADLGDLSKELRSLLNQHKGSLGQCQNAWSQVLDVVDAEVASMSHNIAESRCMKLEDADRESLLTSRENLPECFRIVWPCKDTLQSCQTADVTEEVSAAPESFKINLYANPTARATQDAVVAALPPARRLETLLSVSKAGELGKVTPQFLQAWQESPDECAAVVLRSDAEGNVSWPIEVLAPLLAALVECETVGWQSAFGRRFPSDRSLFDALWAHLCRVSDRDTVATEFWPWALGALCIARLSGSEKDAEFGINCALRVALTLRADFSCARARTELQQALLVKQIPANETMLTSGRIGGFKQAPIASLLLSLSEILQGCRSTAHSSAVFEFADESLEQWILLIRDVADNCSEADLVAVLVNQLARVRSCSTSLGRYGCLHLAALSSNVSSVGREEVALLHACILARGAPEDVQLTRDSLGLLFETFDPMPLIVSALDAWPIRQLQMLALRVLPAIIDSCQFCVPHGEVVGRDLLVEPPSNSPLLKSIACVLCCAACRAYTNPSEALVQLRLGTDISRMACQSLHAGRSCAERSRNIVELCVLFGSFVRALNKSFPRLLLEASGPTTGAALLMRMLLKAAAQEGHEKCCEHLGETIHVLEGLSP